MLELIFVPFKAIGFVGSGAIELEQDTEFDALKEHQYHLLSDCQTYLGRWQIIELLAKLLATLIFKAHFFGVTQSYVDWCPSTSRKAM